MEFRIFNATVFQYFNTNKKPWKNNYCKKTSILFRTNDYGESNYETETYYIFKHSAVIEFHNICMYICTYSYIHPETNAYKRISF